MLYQGTERTLYKYALKNKQTFINMHNEEITNNALLKCKMKT